MEPRAWSFVLLCVAASLAAAWLREYLKNRDARRLAEAALTTQDVTLRLLRLSAVDQRNLALTLLGHADTCAPDESLAGLARRLLDMSDNLTQQTETPAAVRILAEEDFALRPVVEFAVEQVAAHLGPARRAWRLDPALHRMRLCADRRALNQVLVNVLSGAAASTRDGDWIEIGIQPESAGWSIVVQDEGVGLPVARNDTHPEESRGIGLRLTLARSLMQAHGGSLTVESAERVGTKVRLGVPSARVLERPGAAAQLSPQPMAPAML